MQPARWLWKGLLLLAALGSMAATLSVDTAPFAHQTQPTLGVSAALPAETPAFLLINEIDAIAASEAAEFIELYDGGVGNTPLDGLSLVLYRGDGATVYRAIGLDGHTDSRGYYVIGGPAIDADYPVAAGLLRDGPDAVALYAAWPWQFPVGNPVVTEGLLDAVVYAPGAAPVAGLQPLLLPDELPLDEAQQGTAAAHSAQRYPNGGGEARQTSAFIVAPPTPSEPNANVFDATPFVAEVWPADDATGVATPVTLVVTFSEPVALDATPLDIQCVYSGGYPYTLNGGPVTFRFRPYVTLAAGDTCQVLVYKDRVHDLDSNDPPDIMGIDAKWNFTTAPAVAQNIVLNEIDADTPGTDTAEFIELFDGGTGATPLDGLLLVLFNGGDDRSYRTIDLAGQTTDAAGYWLAGNAAIAGAEIELPDGALQNGTDAVALVAGRAEAFPNGTPVDGVTPQDAVVYGQSGEPDVGLLALLNEGQPAIDENGRSEAENHSNQRCPNGAGGARNTDNFRQNSPTPRAGNDCQTDTAPIVTERTPTPGAGDVAIAVALSVTFSEPVALSNGWLTLTCTLSGAHPYNVTGGPSAFTAQPSAPFAYAETCTATLKAAKIRDLDSDDPPDSPDGNLTWKFTTAAAPADFVLINEADADTPGSDTAEFVELYDGGAGKTDLSGLVLVFYNGSTNTTYAAFDLDDQRTDAAGYWLAGNAAVNPNLAFANGGLQNGPDALALYAGDATQFPADTPLHTRGLVDAVVYGDATSAPGLLALLLAGESAADEGARDAADVHALQRCPNGAGGQRRTAALRPGPPTPGAPNNCAIDAAPNVVSVLPANASNNIAVASALTMTFNEPVTPAAGWLRLNCAANDYAMTIASVDATTYKATPTALLPPATTCQATIAAALVHDADSDDPPDNLAADYSWSFATAAPVANFVLINELDSDTPGSDTAEFVELYDGGTGGTDLSGLVLVFFNGSDDRSYYAVDLDGATTDDDGYAVIGSAGLGGAVTLPTAVLQNGPDAVSLYEGNAGDFPNGATLTTAGLRDALVYGTSDPTDTDLLRLLAAGQTQVDENARAAAETDSSGRCPNASGGLRQTASYRQNRPTPGAPNDCHIDAAPNVVAVSPADGAGRVAAQAHLEVTFSETMSLDNNWFSIICDASGNHAAATAGGPTTFTLTLAQPFNPNEQCTATLRATAVHDADVDDPPDTLAADYVWRFRTAPAPAGGILINELDSDTPGNDTAEFVELYDGGAGETDLSGLVLVFFNGKDDRAYFAADLDGVTTGGDGYAVVGSAALAGVVALPTAVVQNGPDAVALYEGDASAFPNGAALTTDGLRDALVYGTSDPTDNGLLALLTAGQEQVDENARAAAETDSSGRCPNASGGLRQTASYRPNRPTPGAPNDCHADAAPTVVAVSPAGGAEHVAVPARLQVQFSEAVTLDSDWFTIACATSGNHAAATEGGPATFTLTPLLPFTAGEACTVTLRAAAVRDADSDDPPDGLAADYAWRFRIAPAVVDGILINEVDSDTPGKDTAEFIELYDGGRSHVDLSGLVVVLWNGSDDTTYKAIDLAGQQTDDRGYLVLGGEALAAVDYPLANATLQNGPDAIALYAADADAFPPGTPLTITGLRDAVVYGPADDPDSGLLALLEAGQPQVDEAGRGDAPAHALQRCPNGDGGPRRTSAFRPAPPSPGAPNPCPMDAPPAVSVVSPAVGAVDVPLTTTLVITFTEAVTFSGDWFALTCDGHEQEVTTLPGETWATVVPGAALPEGAACMATIAADSIHDADSDDPPDTLPATYTWSFTTPPAPPPLVARFTSNSPVWAAAPVLFTNTTTGPATPTYTWDFGDGHGSTQTHPRHTYAAPGTYIVTLTAVVPTVTTDLTATYSATVLVRPRCAFAPLSLSP